MDHFEFEDVLYIKLNQNGVYHSIERIMQVVAHFNRDVINGTLNQGEYSGSELQGVVRELLED